MNGNDQERMKTLLRQALPPVEGEPGCDLWPAVLGRLDARPVSPPWFDWALMGGLVALGAFFPAAIPMFLYYL
jgi:hypothetical protein